MSICSILRIFQQVPQLCRHWINQHGPDAAPPWYHAAWHVHNAQSLMPSIDGSRTTPLFLHLILARLHAASLLLGLQVSLAPAARSRPFTCSPFLLSQGCMQHASCLGSGAAWRLQRLASSCWLKPALFCCCCSPCGM